MKVGSFGVIFVFMLIIFIIITGVMAFTNTEFNIGSAENASQTDWNTELRTITMANENFSPLAGILGLGYFLHTCSLPITRSAAKPENNPRDMFLGYLFVFISYIVIGSCGYIGFIGTDFTDYYVNHEATATAGQIAQNCLLMFDYLDVAAFVLRSAIFLLIFSGYPLVHFFL
jgi:amino acid transporter